MFQNPWYAGQPAAAGGGPDGATAAVPAAGAGPDGTAEVVSNEDAAKNDPLSAIQQRLKSGWTAHITSEGRLFYCK